MATTHDDDSWFSDANIFNAKAITYCPNNHPIINFANRNWWINYHWKDNNEGIYEWKPFNSIFDPTIIKAGNNGIQLQILPPLPGKDPKVWRTSEIVLLDKLGYGDYLITARADNGSFSDLDPNTVFGVFLYQRSDAPSANGPNIKREIDFLEVLRSDQGNAQFTLQPYEYPPIKPAHPVRFFKIPPATNIITIYNYWYPGPNGLASDFWCYAVDWSFDKGDPPQSKLVARWALPEDNPNIKSLIPGHTATSCERLHINLWLMQGVPPAKAQSVTITRFQYRPHT